MRRCAKVCKAQLAEEFGEIAKIVQSSADDRTCIKLSKHLKINHVPFLTTQ